MFALRAILLFGPAESSFRPGRIFAHLVAVGVKLIVPENPETIC